VSATTTKDPRDVILAPVVSEKSYGLIDEGKYTFLVDPRSNKTEIKLAVETIFNVKVDSVNTINRAGSASAPASAGVSARTPSARSSA
jgi:large subunit ribosomal protein L23